MGAANMTAQAQHCGKTFMFNTDAADRTLTLPPAALCKYGRITAQKTTNDSTNELIIDGDGSETINNITTASTTTAYGNIVVESDGTEWFIHSSL